jgi:dipeptidyl aminopeptidase/acylaminoacyl peptidase
VNRRAFLVTASGSFYSRVVEAQGEVTQPVIAEADAPLEVIGPAAHDGHRGLGVLRKPPGKGPFPAIIHLHGGITTMPIASLRATATNGANPSRFLAAGYVVVVPTYRSRDVDPQSPVSLDDAVAVVDYVRALQYVDGKSIVMFGCSGGGDLALQVPTRTTVCAVVAEEPASMLMAGMYNNRVPKKGERYTPEDGFAMMENPRQHYTPESQEILRTRVAKINCPILIIQGDANRRMPPINQFNAEILIPALHAANKTVEVRSYADQGHCFCAGSRVPRLTGLPTPASAPPAALEAFKEMDAFYRKHLPLKPRNIDAALLKHVPVRTSWESR